MGIVHRDLNPGNIFLHFPDIPFPNSPDVADEDPNSLTKNQLNTCAETFAQTNPMARVTGCQLKIIDFNHSRMFNLDDSPIRIRRTRSNIQSDLTDSEAWRKIADLPSPAVPYPKKDG